MSVALYPWRCSCIGFVRAKIDVPIGQVGNGKHQLEADVLCQFCLSYISMHAAFHEHKYAHLLSSLENLR